jgi:radical SAM superfamily enzyme YgiQ (UPF0313 family)
MNNWRERLASITSISDRLAMSKESDASPDLLKMFIESDYEASIIISAAIHPNCSLDMLQHAANRAGWRLELLLEHRKQHLEKLNKNFIDEPEENEGKFAFSDRDAFLVQHVLKKDNKHADIHLGDYSVHSRREKLSSTVIEEGKVYKGTVTLIICPAWGIIFPPYNIARLTGLLRAQGYKVLIYDLNIKAYHVLKEKTGMDFWSSEKYHYWFETKFDEEIWPHIKDMIHDAIEEIYKSKPDLIGFSLYNTNMWCSRIVMQMLRDLLDDTTIIVGGPEASQDKVLHIVRPGVINYVFKGEAEGNLLTFLEEKNYNAKADAEVIGNMEGKLQIDELPFPDYRDYNLDDYLHSDGVSIETSRGCVAQCSFCSETWFWKFRQRTPERVIEEMKEQISKHGVRRFWFVDSLANGNLKAFRRLVELMIENKLNVRWNSYARNDGRMDRQFIFDIARSGCTSLSYGVESGSQKVLDDMRKKVELWEIEKNLEDSFDAGMDTHVNWMIGFPTEDNLDFLHSMVMIKNTVKYIAAISPGMGCGPAAFSELELEWKKFKITWEEKAFDKTFLGHWYTENFKNTALHRVIRIKLFAILLEILKTKLKISPHNGQRYDDISKFYEFTITGISHIQNRVEKLDNLDLNFWTNDQFSSNIANEFPGIMWMIYQIFKCGFKLKIKFDPIVDYRNFGAFIAVNYNAEINIEVDDSGNYKISVDHELKHETFNSHWAGQFDLERSTYNMSFNELNTKTGNLSDLIIDKIMVEETIHEQYRNKKKVIEIKVENKNELV